MRDLNKLERKYEDDRLFWALMNVEEECPLIYQEFGLDSQVIQDCLQILDTAYREQSWLEVIDWATTLAQNTKFDLLENGIDINVMNRLLINLLEVIEVARIKYSREL